MALQSRPVVPVSLAFALGCVLAAWSQAPALSAVGIALVGIAAAVYSFGSNARRLTVLCVAFCLLGFARAAIFQTPSADDVSHLAKNRTSVVLGGFICSDPLVESGRVSFLFKPDQAYARGKRVGVAGKVAINHVLGYRSTHAESLEYGQALRIEGVVSLPRGARNLGEHSPRDYLARQGVFSQMWLERPGSLQVLEKGHGTGLIWLARRASGGVGKMIFDRMPEQQAGLVSGMLLGSYSLVPDDIIRDFTRSGTLHLLAASGFNCALIVAIFWHGLFRRFRAPRMAGIGITIVMVVFYTLMVGAKPSIMRAGVGAVIYLLALLLGRPADMWNVLFSTMLIILFISPLSVGDVGFQLSFAAVASILAFVPLLPSAAKRPGDLRRSFLVWLSRFPRAVSQHVLEAGTVTMAATLGTLPILAQYFNRVSLVSLPANVAVAFLAEMLFLWSTALAFLNRIPGLSDIIVFVVALLASWVEEVVRFFGSFKFAQVNTPSPGLLGTAIYYSALALVWRLVRQRRNNPS